MILMYYCSKLNRENGPLRRPVLIALISLLQGLCMEAVKTLLVKFQ